jgi:peptidyl-prolyl cis-trans isomerase SurA
VKKIKRHIFLFALVVFSAGAHAQQVLDRIVAIVDREIITETELNFQVTQYAIQNKLDPSDQTLKRQILDQLIADKLVLAQAVEDSIVVTEDEVTRQLDDNIKRIVMNYGSEQRVEELYGMPVSRIKREFRDNIKKQMLSQRLQQKKFGEISVSPHEVEEFMQTVKDSLPMIPKQVVVSQIFISSKPSDSTKMHARAKMQLLLDSLKKGADFQDLAKKYSQDGSAQYGGDLGWAKRGSFVKEFEETAFALRDGQISNIVETQFGYHIVQLVERKGEAVHTRHILMKVERTTADDDSVKAKLIGIRSKILAGEKFSDYARQFSEDEESRPFGGDIGEVLLDQLAPDFRRAVSTLKPDEISEPISIALSTALKGYAIVLVRNIIPEHRMNLESDYKRLEHQALIFKQSKNFERWIEELKKNIYWENRL